jgi:hypothetical protein
MTTVGCSRCWLTFEGPVDREAIRQVVAALAIARTAVPRAWPPAT